MKMSPSIHTTFAYSQVREKQRKSRGIDYNAEVAFEKRAAPGFFDTGAELALTREVGKEFRPVTVEEMEGKRPRVRPPPPLTCYQWACTALHYLLVLYRHCDSMTVLVLE